MLQQQYFIVHKMYLLNCAIWIESIHNAGFVSTTPKDLTCPS